MKSLRKCCSVLALVATVSVASPPVRVKLRTSWPAAPLLLEILESVHTEEPSSFFPLLHAIVSEDIPPWNRLSPEAVEEVVIQTASSLGYLQDPGALEATKMQAALHSASPKIQSFYQFYLEQHSHSSLDNWSTCGSWVDWYGERVCDSGTLARYAEHDFISPSEDEQFTNTFDRPRLLPIDHILPNPSLSLESPPYTAIFYANINSPNFKDLHSLLYKLATQSNPRLEYVFRHIPEPGTGTPKQSFLSGYGVALDLKKTDYLVVDDRHASAHGSSDSKESSVIDKEDSLVDRLLSEYPEVPQEALLVPPGEDDVRVLAIKATQLVANSSNPLQTLLELSQNFPKYASDLSHRVILNESVVEEVQENNVKAQGGASMMWLNGVTVEEKDINPQGLLRLLRKERHIMRSLASLGLSPRQSIDLLTHKAIYGAQQDSAGALDGIFDASDRPEGGDVIVWWNDLTQDSRYARWNPSLTGLMRQLYPGQFHNVKQNLVNVIIVADLSQTSTLRYIAGPVNAIISRGFPIRFGFVPSVETEDGVKMAHLFRYLIKNFGRSKTIAFFAQIGQVQLPAEAISESVDWQLVTNVFTQLLRDADQPPVELGAIIGGGWESTRNTEGNTMSSSGISNEEFLERARAYASRLDASLSAFPRGHAFVNGKHFELDDTFTKSLQMEMGGIVQHFQEKLFLGEISDDDVTTIGNHFYDLPEANTRRNRYIFPSISKGVSTLPGSSDLRLANLPEIFDKVGLMLSERSFVYPSEEGNMHSTIFVVADFNNEDSRGIMLEASSFMETSTGAQTRLAFIHNSGNADLSKAHELSAILAHLVARGTLKEELKNFSELGSTLSKLKLPLESSVMSPRARSADEHSSHESGASHRIDWGSEMKEQASTASMLLLRELGIAPGEIGLVVNGRIISPIAPGTFKADDFASLVNYEVRRRTAPVMEALADLNITSDTLDKHAYVNLVSMVSSVIASSQQPESSEQGLFNINRRPRQRNYRLLSSNYTSFSIGTSDTAIYHLAVLLDPITEVAQRWSVFLQWLGRMPSVYIEVYLNPGIHKDIPLKRFYRYSLPPSLAYDENGIEKEAEVTFDDLPMEPIYTLGLDEAHSWLVRPREAAYDLDNIQLSKLAPEDREKGISALFQLDYLVIEGHARDHLTNAPPRGLQMQLSTLDGSPVDDTQVVLNMGYFQFKAKPGVYQLEIREGRGREVYRIMSAGNEGWDSPTVEAIGNGVTLTDFDGLTLYPRVARNPGMEHVDVLSEDDSEDEDEPEGFIQEIRSRVKSFFGHRETEVKSISSRQADINIFTVASGHLYERFASIMILSVLKNTKSTVKFWFIENFLSPSFLEFLPHYAAAYDFEYELVTYKWPSWLRAQKEKQRIIWAYKILFLDVLFPMDLKKVIFVDADQIVRADLQELVDLNLHGAPYAYTPMGDDNVEMEGFRFWKTGYWKEFLRGLSYHISALYVVDLERFRQIAAGDILRGQYQGLSQDPNSLANLDQDLPNNIQREVPIFSLHEDWLWCETWCSKDRLHRAKTIDLCQNPLTKEPKLVRARKIPEWEAYDIEIAEFARTLALKGSLGSENAKLATEDVARLASSVGPADVTDSAIGGGGQETFHAKDEL